MPTRCIDFTGVEYFIESFKNIFDCGQQCTFIKNTVFIICKTIILLILLSFMHWTTVTIYYYWCHEKGYMGIITNMFVVGSPICIALNKLQVALSENYIAFVVSCGVGFGMFVKGIVS